MKKRFIFFLFALLCVNQTNLFAQTISSINNSIVAPVGTNSVDVIFERVSGGWSGGGGGAYTWSVTPNNGVSFTSTSNDGATLTFSNLTLPSIFRDYTVTLTRDNGKTASKVIKVFAPTMWASYSTSATYEVRSFAIDAGINYAPQTSVFSVATSFAALGRTKNTGPEAGFFYWMPNESINNGSFTMYGRNANGNAASVAVVNSFDVNGNSNTDLGFVRLGLDKTGVSWILAGNGSNLYLIKVPNNALASVTPTVVDDNVTLNGGSVSTFQNGDICIDGSGKIYALANSGSTTQIFIGVPNGNNTELTKKWDVLDENGNAFTGSVNGCCLDFAGGMYLSTNGNSISNMDGIYYLTPSTINGAAGTVRAQKVFEASGYTDLTSNAWPEYTTLPVNFGDIFITKDNANAIVKWETYSEQNASHYEVEYSTNALDFSKAGEVYAYGNSAIKHTYNYSINVAGKFGNLYVRIKSVDKDGKYSYSKIVCVNLDGREFTSIVKIFPNPVKDNLSLQITSNKVIENLKVDILSTSGQLVATRYANAMQGTNLIDLSNNIKSLPKGNYIVRINNPDLSKSMIFVKE